MLCYGHPDKTFFNSLRPKRERSMIHTTAIKTYRLFLFFFLSFFLFFWTSYSRFFRFIIIVSLPVSPTYADLFFSVCWLVNTYSLFPYFFVFFSLTIFYLSSYYHSNDLLLSPLLVCFLQRHITFSLILHSDQIFFHPYSVLDSTLYVIQNCVYKVRPEAVALN